MFNLKILVLKLFPINRFSSSSIKIIKITSLCHKVWNYSMKDRIFKAKSFFTSTKSSEVLSCFRDYILEKLKNNLICLSSKLYFKKNSRVGLDLAFLYYRVDFYLDLFFFDRFRFRFRVRF